MPLLQSPMQLISILAAVGKHSLPLFKGNLVAFSCAAPTETFQFKLLNYRRDRDSFSLGFETHNQAPFDTRTAAKSVMWRLNTYAGDWRVPARDYRNWMEQTFKPRRLSEMPDWVGDIGLVVTNVGVGIGDTDILDKLAEQIDSTKTLLMVNGVFKGREWWTGGEYYPDYKVRTGFGRFMEVAHRHGISGDAVRKSSWFFAPPSPLRRFSEISISRPMEQEPHRLGVGHSVYPPSCLY